MIPLFLQAQTICFPIQMHKCHPKKLVFVVVALKRCILCCPFLYRFFSWNLVTLSHGFCWVWENYLTKAFGIQMLWLNIKRNWTMESSKMRSTWFCWFSTQLTVDHCIFIYGKLYTNLSLIRRISWIWVTKFKKKKISSIWGRFLACLYAKLLKENLINLRKILSKFLCQDSDSNLHHWGWKRRMN